MERPGSPAKPSSIPRPGGSRLPTLRKQASQLPTPKPKREELLEPSRTIPRKPAPQKRASTSSFRSSQAAPKDALATSQAFQRRGNALASKPSLNLKTAAQSSKPAPLRPSSRGNRGQQQPTPLRHAGTTEDEENNDQLASLDSFRSASRLGSRDGQPVSPDEYVEPQAISTPKQRKPSRPSLSDRTMESLSSLPTTPRDRRRSSFFSPVESPMGGPMGPPPRPGSSLSRNSSNAHSRPGTSDGAFAKPALGRPASPNKRTSISARPATRTSLGGFGFTPGAGGRRSISAAYSSKMDGAREGALSIAAAASPSKTPKPTALSNDKTASKIGMGSKTIGARPTKPRQALGGSTFSRPKPKFNADTGAAPVASRPPPSPKPSSQPKASSTASPSQSSSAALRQQIAAAKAAARASKQKRDSTQDLPTTTADSYDLATDPFNQAPKDPSHILRNRITTARMDGKLNIAAMQLTQIPPEVMKMYDAATLTAGRVNWAEVVDLTRLNIADNELEVLSPEAFPDVSMEELMDRDEDDEQAPPFAGLESLDAHGNKLTALPMGMRRLERLTRLDLAHNRLDNSVLDVVAQMTSLKEVKLGHNQLAGNLPSAFCQLPHLESLDLQSNRLLALPEALRELVNLKILNVSGNQLTSLPIEALQQIPLTELNASKNALIGSLFPLGCPSEHRTLRKLEVAHNSLAALTFAEGVELPSLQSLDVTNNHLAALPNLAGWANLTTLMAGENKIAEIPEGFTQLEKLRNVGLANNELRVLEPAIARMETLVTLVLSGNPMRERRYLIMSVEELKRDLRRKLEPEEVAGAELDEGEYQDIGDQHLTKSVRGPKWTMKPNNTLDLSSQGLTNAALEADLPDFLQEHEVRHLLLARNTLTKVPPYLTLVASSLQTLDLSHNPFDSSAPLAGPLELPRLTSLTITAANLSTLDILTTTLLLPRLQNLNISSNRLTGPLPALATTFPNLRHFHAGNNKITSIDPESVQGCATVDLSNNALDALPAELGLLWFEGLKHLEVGGNRFRVPGWRVLESGTEGLCRWLRGRIEGYVEEQ